MPDRRRTQLEVGVALPGAPMGQDGAILPLPRTLKTEIDPFSTDTGDTSPPRPLAPPLRLIPFTPPAAPQVHVARSLRPPLSSVSRLDPLRVQALGHRSPRRPRLPQHPDSGITKLRHRTLSRIGFMMASDPMLLPREHEPWRRDKTRIPSSSCHLRQSTGRDIRGPPSRCLVPAPARGGSQEPDWGKDRTSTAHPTGRRREEESPRPRSLRNRPRPRDART